MLWVSDLHLSGADDPKWTRLQALVERLRPQTLFLLGDIFDAWIGWDDMPVMETSFRAWVRNLGIKVFWMPGNRDNLLMQACDLVPMDLLPDPCLLHLLDRKILMTHGDRYCVQDPGHLRWKSWQESALAPWFLSLPLWIRKRIRQHCQAQSKKHKHRLSLVEQDVPWSVWESLRERTPGMGIIHGHTHRPGHRLGVWTLGDWRESCSYLYYDGFSWSLAFEVNNNHSAPR